MTINTLVIDNLHLAEKLAKSKKKKLTNVSYDELKSAAYLGLVEAANNYRKEENDCFPSFAIFRIIGAIQDYLRELSWGSRSNPLKNNHSILDEQPCKKNNLNFDDFDEIIQILPPVNKMVLKLYYQEDKKIREIAGTLNVHESRISQILTESKLRLKAA
jgi:RNA polymerase sigma factor (sigma-70 family)